MTDNLMNFWNKAGFRLVYLRQTTNDVTGEHTAIMLRALSSSNSSSEVVVREGWLRDFTADALRRITSLLSFEFKTMSTALELAILDNLRRGSSSGNTSSTTTTTPPLTPTQLSYLLTSRDLQRLHLYSKNMVDYHMIRDLLPTLSKIYFLVRRGVVVVVVVVGMCG